jgi:hypothetical protein
VPLVPKACAPGTDNVTSTAGTWDLIDGPDTSVLTIDANTFTFVRDAHTLSLAIDPGSGAMTLSWTAKAVTTPINASRTAAVEDVGVIPLGLGGNWSFSSQTGPEQCTASLAGGTFDSNCNHVNGTPAGTLVGSLTGSRTAKATSIFGELGGTWSFISGGGSSSADVSFAGSVFTATTRKMGQIPNGTMAVRVCEGTVSGITSSGWEFAGIRR